MELVRRPSSSGGGFSLADDFAVQLLLGCAFLAAAVVLWALLAAPRARFRPPLAGVLAVKGGRLRGEDALARVAAPTPAPEVIRVLVDDVRDTLENSGDLAVAEEGIEQVRKRGRARIQREALKRTGSLRYTVASCITRTLG
ncbi:DUF2568 domain-containing protein [Streptomyces sp. NPDC058369]|uniref:YrdB family protein n=1 Tax=Streptomyces sp. NPDC058369 TaxID=3346462 RepID=UPI003652C489